MSANTEVTKEVSRTEDLRYGRRTVGTSATTLAERITTDSTGKTFRGVLIKCDANNTSPVYVGGVTVSAADGFPIQPGEFLELPVDDPSLIYVISDDSDQLIAWIGV